MPSPKAQDSLAVRRAVDAGKIPPVWLWTGPEDYLKDELFTRLAARVTDEGMAAVNVNRYRAGKDELAQILGTCQTIPMLSERRAVLVQEIEKWSKTEREAVRDYVADPAPQTALVLAGAGGPSDAFHRGLTGAGVATAVFWTPFENQTVQWIQIRFKELGKRCDADLAGRLFELCGAGDQRQVPLWEVAPEIEKVALALGDTDTVTEEALDVIGRKADEAMLFEIGSRVTVGDLPGALRALDGALLFRKNSEIYIVATLAQRVMTMIRVRDFLDRGLSPPEAKREARVWPQKAWPEIERGLRRHTRASLSESLRVLLAADRTLKSSPRKPRTVLEETIVKLCHK